MPQSNLEPYEQTWVTLQPFLLSRGYLTSPRYKPGWKAPKKENDSNESTYERPKGVIDAVRLSDKKSVVLKLVESNTKELHNHTLILSLEQSPYHFISIYDTIILPDSDDNLVLVLPLVHPVGGPPFESVFETLACFLQFSEGLALLHENNIAHGDIHPGNIAMRPDEMYLRGWHFVSDLRYLPGLYRGSLKTAPFVPRCLAPPTYCFMDFGNTVRFQKGQPPYYLGSFGKYHPPEMHATSVCDTFKVDIWCLGNALKWLLPRDTGRQQEDVGYILSWLEKLLRRNPLERPTAQEVVQDLCEMIKTLSDDELRKPLRTIDTKWPWSFKETFHAVNLILHGHGDEEILFAKLRGTKPPRDPLNFSEGSFATRLELMGRVFRFLSGMGLSGNTLSWITPHSKTKKVAHA